MKNYYRRLGVSLMACPDDIKRAYHREARRTHPDTSGVIEQPKLELSLSFGGWLFGLFLNRVRILRSVRFLGSAAFRLLTGQFLLWLGRRLFFSLQQVDVVLAFPKDTAPATVSAEDLEVSSFPRSRAVCAIVSVDSSYFEVYAKDSAVAECIRNTFHSVVEHNPLEYFA